MEQRPLGDVVPKKPYRLPRERGGAGLRDSPLAAFGIARPLGRSQNGDRAGLTELCKCHPLFLSMRDATKSSNSRSTVFGTRIDRTGLPFPVQLPHLAVRA